MLGADISLNINLADCISIRKVRIFLSELKILLTSENITDRIGKEYTLPEVLAKYRKPKNESEEEKTRRLQEFKNLIYAAENCTICEILFLLDYELQIQQTEKEPGEIATEPLNILKDKNKNEKIDRIVWNILANGTSELTNIEHAVQKLQQEVLDKDIAEQIHFFPFSRQ